MRRYKSLEYGHICSIAPKIDFKVKVSHVLDRELFFEF